MRSQCWVMAEKQQESCRGQRPMTNFWSKYRSHLQGCCCLWLGCCCSWWRLWRTKSFRASSQKGVFFSMSQWLFGGWDSKGGLKIWLGIGLGRWLGTLYSPFHGFSFLCTLGERSMINGSFESNHIHWSFQGRPSLSFHPLLTSRSRIMRLLIFLSVRILKF